LKGVPRNDKMGGWLHKLINVCFAGCSNSTLETTIDHVDHIDQSFKDLIISVKNARDITAEEKSSQEPVFDDDTEKIQGNVNRRRAHSFQDIFNRKSVKKKQQRQSSLERSR